MTVSECIVVSRQIVFVEVGGGSISAQLAKLKLMLDADKAWNREKSQHFFHETRRSPEELGRATQTQAQEEVVQSLPQAHLTSAEDEVKKQCSFNKNSAEEKGEALWEVPKAAARRRQFQQPSPVRHWNKFDALQSESTQKSGSRG